MNIKKTKEMESTKPSYLSSKYPLVLRNKINNWKILNYKNGDWCQEFKNKSLKFREGDKIFRPTPYWEQLCNEKEMTLDEFFELSSGTSNKWHYFDYKYMKDVFPETSGLLNEIKWTDLNLFDLTGHDSTLWIGNEGAHTPCHMDTYGCNVVAQISGKKLWILIPPEETDNLNPVRVPYEESSVYSSWNFYTPNDNLLKIKKAYKVVLTPGDVLFVPRHWWHYVENLQVSISINVWIPLDEDHESRLEESLVQHYISNIIKDLTPEERKQILNPNEYNLISEPCSFDLIQKCIEKCQKFKKKKKTENEVEGRGESNQLEQVNLKSYVNKKSKLLNYDSTISTKSVEIPDKISLVKRLINLFCHPKNIFSVKESLLNQNEGVQ